MAELHWGPAYQLAATMRRRELKPSELMEATLARIRALNLSINALRALRAKQALAEARELDEMIARGDKFGRARSASSPRSCCPVSPCSKPHARGGHRFSGDPCDAERSFLKAIGKNTAVHLSATWKAPRE
jgi:hypothetical protein